MKKHLRSLILSCITFMMLLPCTTYATGALGGFWTQLDGDDTGKGEGYGIKLLLPLAGSQSLALKWSELSDFEKTEGELDVNPIELGFHLPLSNDKTALYAEAGLGWFQIDGRNADGTRLDIEDEIGWYVSLGAKIAISDALQFTGEVLYRGVEAEADFDNLDKLTDLSNDKADVELDGIGYELGILLRW